ncbi:hypothetical protein HOO68_01345, partial [Candidatus Gracilibacteria bacterium]|nr:hypothetical protein [Candidatus Gracilibacteria bacterium]
MFNQIFQHFLSLRRFSEHPEHHPSLFLLLLLALFCQQFFVSGKVSALSVIPKIPKAPQTYIYVRTSPIIDDSWIGTLVNFTKSNKAINTSSNNQTDYNSIDLNSASSIDQANTVWVKDWKQSISIIEGNQGTIEFNSAPLVASLQGAFSEIFNTIFGRLTTNEKNIAILSNNLSTLSGVVNTLDTNLSNVNTNNTNSNIETLSGRVMTNEKNINTLSGDLAITNANLASIGGYITSFSTNLTFGNGISRVGNHIGLINGANGEILSMSGGVPTWVIPGAATAPVTTVFGRLGAISAQAGDYTTTQVTEGSNLYFTNTRAQNALSGTIAAITGSIATTNSNVTSLSGSLGTTNSNLATTNSNVTSLSGSLATLNTTVSTLSGSTVGLTASLNSLSGTV